MVYGIYIMHSVEFYDFVEYVQILLILYSIVQNLSRIVVKKFNRFIEFYEKEREKLENYQFYLCA